MSSTQATSPTLTLATRLFRSFTRSEWWLLSALCILVLCAGSYLLYQRWIAQTSVVSAAGGTYTEGVVATSLADVTPTLDVLTKIGLTQYDRSGTLVPAVADHWEVRDDGKTYAFTIRDDIDTGGIASVLEEQQQLFADISIEFPDDRTVMFSLKQPFTPFLATTATPLFPYGPYQVEEQQKGIVRLVPNHQTLVTTPLLEELVLRIYPDSFNLTQALQSKEIDGVADTSLVENERLVEKLHPYTVTLPRKIFLFFNTEHDVVKNPDLRRKLRDGESVEGNPEITLVTLANPRHEKLAQDIVSRWGEQGARVIVETRTATDLANSLVPSRSYDVLIYGLDFGGDPDPYPFWHSSQIGEAGLNLSNFANIDADRLLEKARQTLDQAERESLYKQFNDIFQDQTPAIELEHVVVTFGVDPEMKGVESLDGLSVADRYAFVEQWYQKTRRMPLQ